MISTWVGPSHPLVPPLGGRGETMGWGEVAVGVAVVGGAALAGYLLWTRFGGGEGQFAIAGRVYDAVTMVGIPRVRVVVGTGAAVTTDGQGMYRYPVGIGTHMLTVRAAGYVEASRSVVVDGSSSVVRVDVGLAAEPEPEPEPERRTITFQGTVRDAYTPYPAIVSYPGGYELRVTAKTSGGRQLATTTTDANGFYRLSPIPNDVGQIALDFVDSAGVYSDASQAAYLDGVQSGVLDASQVMSRVGIGHIDLDNVSFGAAGSVIVNHNYLFFDTGCPRGIARKIDVVAGKGRGVVGTCNLDIDIYAVKGTVWTRIGGGSVSNDFVDVGTGPGFTPIWADRICLKAGTPSTCSGALASLYSLHLTIAFGDRIS